MTEYTINEMTDDTVILTRHEKITTSGRLTIDLSKSIIFETHELTSLLETLTDYANKTRDS